ncbi:GGDEF domain-containing protein [Ideonella sp. BN130291]|uniref:GGDEF domain-containing protein n=1 Tax=Ideonella sp. BN130291 TaxID=3112940 RepID=UPI002E25D452|nr:GGDEF domain-containing protein [Ideonella sp. BN130291]
MLATCIAMPLLDPQRYDARVEAVHFLLCLVSLPVISAVAADLSTTRAKWKAQRQALADALGRIQILATRDELTGLVNRRHMQELLHTETLRARRSGHAACIAMLDLDFFKAVNDRFGHAGGDTVLKTFANLAVATARRSDVVCRWGGEEFLWLLPDTTAADAELALQRLHVRLSQTAEWIAGESLQITMSAGMTELRGGEAPEAAEAAVERADQALYEAKRQGRHRTVVRLGP